MHDEVGMNSNAQSMANTARHNYKNELLQTSNLAFSMRIHSNLVAFRTKEYFACTEDPNNQATLLGFSFKLRCD